MTKRLVTKMKRRKGKLEYKLMLLFFSVYAAILLIISWIGVTN